MPWWNHFFPLLRQPANLIGELIYEEFHRAPPEKHVSQYLGDQRDLCLRTALVWWTDLTPGLKPRPRTLTHANEKERERVVSPGTGAARPPTSPVSSGGTELSRQTHLQRIPAPVCTEHWHLPEKQNRSELTLRGSEISFPFSFFPLFSWQCLLMRPCRIVCNKGQRRHPLRSPSENGWGGIARWGGVGSLYNVPQFYCQVLPFSPSTRQSRTNSKPHREPAQAPSSPLRWVLVS